IVQLITDQSKAEELKAESNRLLGAPIPLPEGRPEEETPPLGFTPEGIPFYSEAERDRLMAQTSAPAEPPVAQLTPSAEAPAAAAPAPAAPAAASPAPAPSTAVKEPEPGKEDEKKEPTEKKPLDLDF
ncbi:unnamed protein product, partial [marine sediment metagenome]